MPHKFAVGQSVVYFGLDPRNRDAGRYTVIRLLPKDAVDYQYHVQRTGGGEQRLVREAQLQSIEQRAQPASRPSSAPLRINRSLQRSR